LCAGCRTGSLQAPRTSEQLNTSPASKKTVNCSRDDSSVATPLHGVVEPQSSSSPGSHASTSSQESDEILIPKPQPPPALRPSILSNPVKCPRPKLPQFLLVEGEMSVEEDDSSIQDTVSSKSTSSDKSVKPPVEGRCTMEVGSDVSSEPLTFHTDFGDGCNTVASSDEERRNLEVLSASRSKLGSKFLDVNENFGKKEADSGHYGVKEPELTLARHRLNGLLDQQKVIAELCNGSQYLPVTSSNVVVNMALSSVVTQPEDQNSTALESDAADHSHESSESDMSISDEASAQEAPAAVSPNVTAEEKSQPQQPEKSGTNDATSLDHANDAEATNSDRANDVSKSDEADASSDHAKDASKIDAVEQVPSADGETRTVHVRPKSPASEKSESHSKSGKRGRSRSSERNRRRSRSSERKRNRSRSGDRSRKQSGIASVTRSPGHSPKRDSSRQKERKHSRSSSRSRRRRSSSKEHHSRSSRTSSSRSSRNKKRSRSRSRESRRRRSRSRSRDTRRRTRSTDRARRKRLSRSRSTDRSHRRRTSRNEDSERKVDDRSVRQVDRDLASKNHSSDRSQDSPHRRHKSPPQSERAATKRDEKASSEKSENSSAEKAVSNQQSDSDLSSAESGRQPKSHEDNATDNNRIAVISSSSSTNRRLPCEEFESDEETPADLPTAYDPSEPTEDNFRDDGKASERHREPPCWITPPNQRMPMVDMSRPPPPVFPSRLPPPPPLSRFPHRPPHEGVMRDMKPALMPPNHFGVSPSDGGRPPLHSPMNVPPRLPMPPEVQPPLPFSQPMLTTPAGVLPQPPVRLPPGINVDRMPLIVRGPMEPARLFFVPPGVGQPIRLTEATSLVGLPRLVCPPAQGAMADLVRLPLGQPQPRPGTILSGPPFVSGNQVMIRPAPVLFQQVPERRVESPQSAPQILTSLPIPQISAAQQPLVSNMPEMPFSLNSGQPTLPNIPGPPGPPGVLSQPQPTQALSSSSASSPSSGSQDAEDMLLERYRAKPEPPQCLFPSQKAPDPLKPPVDAQQKSPDRTSEDSEKSSDRSQPPQPPPVPDARTSVTTSSDVVPTSTSSESVPSDPRLLLQFLLKQTRQSTATTDGTVPPSDDQSSLVRPLAPQELHGASINSPEIVESPVEKTSKNKAAYSPSQADYLGEEEDDDGNQQSESVREMKVCSRLSFDL